MHGARRIGDSLLRTPLQPTPFRALPVGAIRLSSWLYEQLLTQANGLIGHLDEFWSDVGIN